jgi:enoyl-CoA hydratase/carnithine racemase
VIAAVHGACIGAGVDLITACDIRYCTQDAYFSVKEVDLGLAADLGSLQRLVKIIGNQGQVSEWCLTGRPVDSQEAQRSGLVGRVFSGREELIKASEELAQLIASKSPVAVCGTKMALVHARDHSVTEGLDYIATWNCAMYELV